MPGPVLEFVQTEDGRIHRLSPWFPLVSFSLEFLQRAPAPVVEYRGDEVILRCANGWARYALSAFDSPDARAGRLVECG